MRTISHKYDTDVGLRLNKSKAAFCAVQVLQRSFLRCTSMLAEFHLAPIQALMYPVTSAATALRQFSRARHIGKIVAHTPPAAAASDGAAAEVQGMWMVTGGLGSLGLVTAQWLADQGRRHICLLGRTGRCVEHAFPCRASRIAPFDLQMYLVIFCSHL